MIQSSGYTRTIASLDITSTCWRRETSQLATHIQIEASHVASSKDGSHNSDYTHTDRWPSTNTDESQSDDYTYGREPVLRLHTYRPEPVQLLHFQRGASIVTKHIRRGTSLISTHTDGYTYGWRHKYAMTYGGLHVRMEASIETAHKRNDIWTATHTDGCQSRDCTY